MEECFGVIKYLIPFGIIGVAIAVAKEDGKYVKSKLLQGLILLGCIASVFTIYEISLNNIDKTKGFESVVQSAYSLGALFSEFGAAVVSLGAAAILLVFTFRIRPSEIINNLADRLEESRALREEEENERIARREARIENSRKRKSLDI